MSKQIKLQDDTYDDLRKIADDRVVSMSKAVDLLLQNYKTSTNFIPSVYSSNHTLNSYKQRSTKQPSWKRAIYMPELDLVFIRAMNEKRVQHGLLQAKGSASYGGKLEQYWVYSAQVEQGTTGDGFQCNIYTPMYILQEHMIKYTGLNYTQDYRWVGALTKYGKMMQDGGREGRTGSQSMIKFAYHLPITKEIIRDTLRDYDECVKSGIPRICSREDLEEVMEYKLANQGDPQGSLPKRSYFYENPTRLWIFPEWVITDIGDAERDNKRGMFGVPVKVERPKLAQPPTTILKPPTQEQTPAPQEQEPPTQEQTQPQPQETPTQEQTPAQPQPQPQPQDAEKMLSSRMKAEEEEKQRKKREAAEKAEAVRRKNEIEGLRVFVSPEAAAEKEAFYKKQEEQARAMATEKKTADEMWAEMWGDEEE